MMPTAGPPPASFLVIDYIVTLITGIFITSYYSLTSPLYGNKFWSKVCGFTVMTSVLEFSLFTLVVFLLLNVPIVLLCSWFISNVIIFFLSGMVFAKLKI